MLVAIPNSPRVTFVSYTPKFSSVCRIGKAPFSGIICIDVEPKDKLLEFISFEKWLIEYVAVSEMTIEELARLVYDEINKLLLPKSLHVAVSAETIVHGPVSAEIDEINLSGYELA